MLEIWNRNFHILADNTKINISHLQTNQTTDRRHGSCTDDLWPRSFCRRMHQSVHWGLSAFGRPSPLTWLLAGSHSNPRRNRPVHHPSIRWRPALVAAASWLPSLPPSAVFLNPFLILGFRQGWITRYIFNYIFKLKHLHVNTTGRAKQIKYET